jgi:hypothetical protein
LVLATLGRGLSSRCLAIALIVDGASTTLNACAGEVRWTYCPRRLAGLRSKPSSDGICAARQEVAELFVFL